MSDHRAIVAAADVLITEILEDAGLPPPTIGIILGSGLGGLTDALERGVRVPTREIEGYPPSTIEGHKGEFHFGLLEGRSVAMLKGRIHVYEGHDLQTAGLPARILCGLGIRRLIITNAAGGANPEFVQGDIMLISDHLNLLCGSPLEGPNVPSWGPRFPDMTRPYPENLRKLAWKTAREHALHLHEGVYAAVRGPQYETPAEVRMLRTLGADAIGMSTVPEVIVAAHMKVPVLGISLIANPAAGLSKKPLSHRDVLAAGTRAQTSLKTLVRGVVGHMPLEEGPA